MNNNSQKFTDTSFVYDYVNRLSAFLNWHQLDNFISKIEVSDRTGCWDWTAVKRNDYGRFKFFDKMVTAHSFSARCYYNYSGSKFSLHDCDNRKCVNPKHLFWGTQKDNMMDAKKKGRIYDRTGEKNHQATITKEKAKEIKYLLKYNSTVIVASTTKTSLYVCQCIKWGKTWKHLNE